MKHVYIADAQDDESDMPMIVGVHQTLKGAKEACEAASQVPGDEPLEFHPDGGMLWSAEDEAGVKWTISKRTIEE